MPNQTAAAPIVVQPSQHWEGNDGPWSTFDIHVGTPPQPARVLISTTLGQTWVISANKTGSGGCNPTDKTSCPQDRGALVNVNSSSTWQDQGLFAVGLEENLPDYGNEFDVADFGIETVGLGLPGSNGVSEPNSIVGALATKDFYLGYLGVTNQPTNFTAFDDPQPSFLSSLKSQQKLPSLSYSYSAGAQYRFRKVYGTLTLGGYDLSRFTPNDISFKFAPDISRDLVVGLQSITFSDLTRTAINLLPNGILTFIDSTVPHIWLPQEACTLFEDIFGLTYNHTLDRYLVNDTLHATLKSQNPSVSFLLGNDVNGGPTVNITLPYAAFDLQAVNVVTSNSSLIDLNSNYFPLRRAVNESQYTLGRTFLQEAYLIVDYERSNFSVSQAAWVDNAQQHIIPIRSVNDTTPAVDDNPKNSSGISIGAIVGIVVAVVVLLILSAIAAFIIRRRRKQKAEKKKMDDDPYRKAEMDGAGKPPIGELYQEGKLGEVDSSSKVEMQGSQPGLAAEKRHLAEIEGSRGGAEIEGTGGGMEMEAGRLRAEMAGDHLAPVELDAGPQGLHELSTPNTSNSELPPPSKKNNERKSALPSPWNRRRKSTPRYPDSASSEDAATPNRRTGAVAWTGRKPRSPTPNDTSLSQVYQPSGPSPRNTGLEVPSPSTTPPDVSSQSSSSRERPPNRGFGPSQHLSRPSNRASPLSSSIHPTQNLRDTDSSSDWDRREPNPPGSPDIWSPVSPSDRSPDNDGSGMEERLMLSPVGNEPRRGTPRSLTPRSLTPRTNPSTQGTPRGGSPLPPGNFF